MSFHRAERFQSSCDRRRTGHATPAGSDHTKIGTLGATLFAPGVVPCASMAPGSDLDSWCAPGDGHLARDGAGHGTARHERPSGVESGHLVGSPGQADAVGVARGTRGAAGSPDGAGSRGDGRTAPWTADDRPRLLSRCGALHDEACHPRLGLDVGRDEAPGPRALGPTRVGLTVAPRAGPARRTGDAATAPDPRGWGPADEAARAPLAARVAAGVGRRWRRCRRGTGTGLREEPGAHGLAPALGCRAVSSASASPAGLARSSPVAGHAPTPLASLGGTRRYALGNGGSGLGRRPTPAPMGLVPYGPGAHPWLAPRRHPLCARGGPSGPAAPGSVLLSRPAGDSRAEPGVGGHALVHGGHL
jgi:hypothetical protein